MSLLRIVFPQIGVGNIVRQGLTFRTIVQCGNVVKVVVDAASLFHVSVPESSLCHPVAAELVQSTALVGVISSSLKVRNSVPPRASGHQLIGTQIVGFHVVVTLVLVKLVYLVVFLYRTCIILVVQGGKGHVFVNHLILFLCRIFGDVFVEYGRIVVKVKGQLCSVEQGVFLDDGVEVQSRSSLEAAQGAYFISCLDVAVAHLVFGNLAKAVRALLHHVKVGDGAFVVPCRIHERAGIEPVAAVFEC